MVDVQDFIIPARYPHEDNKQWYAFVEAQTGYPFIDAGMRQLYKEGWIHHIVRNAIACFLTRGQCPSEVKFAVK